MIPYYDNPVPKEDANGVNIQDEPYDIAKDWATFPDIVKSTSGQFTDDWAETVEYAIKERAGNLRYPHISVYEREGDLECKDNIFYRMMDCKVEKITLANHCTLMMMDCEVTEISGGTDCHLVIKATNKLQRIRGLTNCYVIIEQCYLEDIRIFECRGCKFEIRENAKFPFKFQASSLNTFKLKECIRDNVATHFYLRGVTFVWEKTRSTNGEGVPDGGCWPQSQIRFNEECYFWCVGITVFSVEPPGKCVWMMENRYCNTVVKNSTFGPKVEWVMCKDLGSHWTSEGSTYKQLPHGWAAKRLTATYQYDKFEGNDNKIWWIRDSSLTLIYTTGVIGIDKIIVAKDSTFFFHKSNVESNKNISVEWEDMDITEKQPPAFILPAPQTIRKDKNYVLRLQDYVQRTDRDFEQYHENEIIEKWEITGLPDGLTANEQTGEITGVPTKTGEFEVQVRVKDIVGWSAEQRQQQQQPAMQPTIQPACGGGGGSNDIYGWTPLMQESSQQQSGQLKFTVTEPKFPETDEPSPPGETGWVAPPDPE